MKKRISIALCERALNVWNSIPNRHKGPLIEEFLIAYGERKEKKKIL